MSEIAFDQTEAVTEDVEDGFDATPVRSEALMVDIEGFEGPLDLLLTLARTQKVDLKKISVLALAEQYLSFIAQAQRLRIELAADYLVMAAWLAFLKSRLLLPPPDDETPGESADDLAARLAFQLQRLEAMRRAAAQLMSRDQLGKDFFGRGEPQQVEVARKIEWTATLLDLMRAYAGVKTRESYEPLHLKRRQVFSIDEAIARLRKVMGDTVEWSKLSTFLPGEWLTSERRRTAVASSFAATLELAKRGEIELKQEKTFGPLFLRSRQDLAEDGTVNG